MNTDNTGQQPNTDDTELAKVLEDINGTPTSTEPTQASSGLQFEETPLPAPVATDPPVDETPAVDEPAPTAALPPVQDSGYSSYSQVAQPVLSTPAVSGDLEAIKKNALEELRPLVDRLDLPASEKFDTLLLIIRSTDDQSLISAAYAVAKTIEDETKRAQALLDVIKEIDFFANQTK